MWELITHELPLRELLHFINLYGVVIGVSAVVNGGWWLQRRAQDAWTRWMARTAIMLVLPVTGYQKAPVVLNHLSHDLKTMGSLGDKIYVSLSVFGVVFMIVALFFLEPLEKAYRAYRHRSLKRRKSQRFDE